jgi:hypothetical protein
MFRSSHPQGNLKPQHGWLGLVLCFLLTGLIVYGLPRTFAHSLASATLATQTPFTRLAEAPAANGYFSPESRLWLITRPEQIDQVRYFVAPDNIAKLEQVDYRRAAVVALLAGANTTLAPDQITSRDGVVTVYVHNTAAPGVQPTASVYHLLQIPRSATTQALRKLVLHSIPPASASPSPLAAPARHSTSPLSTPVNP